MLRSFWPTLLVGLLSLASGIAMLPHPYATRAHGVWFVFDGLNLFVSAPLTWTVDTFTRDEDAQRFYEFINPCADSFSCTTPPWAFLASVAFNMVLVGVVNFVTLRWKGHKRGVLSSPASK